MSSRNSKSKEEDSTPVHGYCALCEGRIERGQQWTITKQLNRIHANPDRCMAVLHPKRVEAFLKVNRLQREEFSRPEY